MLLIKRILLSLFLSVMVLVASAQAPKTTKIPVQKFKPPKVKTYWGRQTDSGTISREEALQMIAAPIRVVDDKNVVYTITSYQFLYRKKAVTEDEATGKLTPVNSISSSLFRTTPLPELWRNILTEQLQSGEELHYFDVIVKDAKGRFFFAPELKIKIK
jgi:hypothetical protein